MLEWVRIELMIEEKVIKNETRCAHILVGHLPVGPFSIRNHLPHDDAITPHIAG